MKLSEFLANGNLHLCIKDNQPSPTEEGVKEILVKDGEAIPEIFIPLFLRHNRNFIRNLDYNNSIPVLTKEQEKKYGITFTKPKPGKTELKVKNEWTQEKLTEKMNELKASKFKDWAEENFGKDIDKRKSARSIIVEILMKQEGKR